MESIVISDDNISRSKTNQSSFGLCCCKHTNSKILVNAKTSKNYEYIVEKLVIKRVPLHTEQVTNIGDAFGKADDGKLYSCMDGNDAHQTHHERNLRKQSSILLNSIGQLSPTNIGGHSDVPVNLNVNMSTPLVPQRKRSPELTKFGSDQNWINSSRRDRFHPTSPPPQHSSLTSRPEKSNKGPVPVHLPKNGYSDYKGNGDANFKRIQEEELLMMDPVMKETIHMLGRKRENINEIEPKASSEDSSESEPHLRLDDVYNGNDSNIMLRRQDETNAGTYFLNKIASDINANKDVKWKIIIKQRKDKAVGDNYYEDFPEKH